VSALWLISGTPGAGKTTVSLALCRRYPRSIHIPVDTVREWVKSGYASPVAPNVPQDELERQFLLARGAAARAALDYVAAGFAAIIDDVITTFALEAYQPVFRAGAKCVLLMPAIEVAVERNRTRTNKTFDTAVLEPVSRDVHERLKRAQLDKMGWTVIDSSALSVEETVDAIVARCGL
jgi:cytidylate kinase